MAKWAVSVPDAFRFTFKLWKGTTHVKALEFHETDVVSFFTSIDAVKEKKGCLLVQFPPSFNKAYIGPMEHLLGCIQTHNTSNEWNVAIEFRHAFDTTSIEFHLSPIPWPHGKLQRELSRSLFE